MEPNTNTLCITNNPVPTCDATEILLQSGGTGVGEDCCTQYSCWKGCYEVQNDDGTAASTDPYGYVLPYTHHPLYSEDASNGQWIDSRDPCVTHTCSTNDSCITLGCDQGSDAGDYPGSGVTSVTENCQAPPDCYSENGMMLVPTNQVRDHLMSLYEPYLLSHHG